MSRKWRMALMPLALLTGCAVVDDKPKFFKVQADLYKSKHEMALANQREGDRHPVPSPLGHMRDAVLAVLEDSTDPQDVLRKLNSPQDIRERKILSNWICGFGDDRSMNEEKYFLFCKDEFSGWVFIHNNPYRTRDEIFMRIAVDENGKPETDRPYWFVGFYCRRTIEGHEPTEVKYCVDN